jgi:hypothetical protein
MNSVTAVITLDQELGTIKFALDLQGDSQLDHEILAAAIGQGRDIKIVPAHKNDELYAEFVISDPLVWPRAVRALANRNRVAAGQLTLEEENFNRVEAGLPTIEDEAADQAERVHDNENERRISAGQPTIEEEEDNRYHAAFDADNAKRLASGIPLLTDDDYKRARDERQKKRDAALQAAHDVAVQANDDFAKRRKSAAKPKAVEPPPQQQAKTLGKAPAAPAGLGPTS